MSKADVTPIAVVCADLHLTEKPPPARAERGADWMAVQARYLDNLTRLAVDTPTGEQLPVIIAGDLFDRWNAPPEVIALAMRHLPAKVYAVPGQHDLPHHNTEDMHRSAYGVLVEAERIKHLLPDGSLLTSPGDDHDKSFWLCGFGWGVELTARKLEWKCVTVAVCHRHVYFTSDTAHPGVAEDALVSRVAKKLRGWDVAVFGDNHKGFSWTVGGSDLPAVFNCGGFIPRRADERHVKGGRVGLLMSDRTVQEVFMPTEGDRWLDDKEPDRPGAADFDRFVKAVSGVVDSKFDFVATVERLLNDRRVTEAVKKLVREVVQEAGGKDRAKFQ